MFLLSFSQFRQRDWLQLFDPNYQMLYEEGLITIESFQSLWHLHQIELPIKSNL